MLAKQKQKYDPRKQHLAYLGRRDRTLAAARKKRNERKMACIRSLGGRCADCGKRPSSNLPLACFDFHHIKSRKSEKHVALLLYKAASSSELSDEIKLCVVLCANCHRRRHSK
jgi:hypothetical protein